MRKVVLSLVFVFSPHVYCQVSTYLKALGNLCDRGSVQTLKGQNDRTEMNQPSTSSAAHVPGSEWVSPPPYLSAHARPLHWHYRSERRRKARTHSLFLNICIFLMNRVSTSVYFCKMFLCEITRINSRHFLHPCAIRAHFEITTLHLHHYKILFMSASIRVWQRQRVQ